MNQSYFLKNLPNPLQFWIRPMLLMSLSLHGLFLAIPIPYEKKPTPTKKEPEKVKITQLPTKPSSPTPKATPKISPTLSSAAPKPKSSPVVTPPKPSPVKAALTPPRPQPVRPAALDVPPVPPPAKVIPRPKPQSTPESKQLSPTPSPTPVKTPPSPTTSEASPSPTPLQTPPLPTALETPLPTPAPTPDSAVKDPFADFPFPSSTQPGSLGLLPGDTDKAARNTTDGLEQVVAFYNKELPARKFNPKPLGDEADLKVYEVSKDGGAPQYLHLISKEGKTVIVLASQQIKELNSLKNAEARNPEEIAFYDIVKQLENDENLALAAFESGDTAKFPQPEKFNDVNKFEFRSKTVPFKPISPEELFSQFEAKLSQSGFTQISKEASYGGGLTYKITQGSFTRYLYLVPTSDNRTIVILSKSSPF